MIKHAKPIYAVVHSLMFAGIIGMITLLWAIIYACGQVMWEQPILYLVAGASITACWINLNLRLINNSFDLADNMAIEYYRKEVEKIVNAQYELEVNVN